MSIGLTLPFAESTGSVGLLVSTNSQLQATYYNLKSLLLTDWGERVNQFKLGCNLSEFLFEQSSQETQARVAERIYEQVNTWLPYVTIDSVTVTFPSDNIMNVRVVFSLQKNQDTGSVEVTVSQMGG